MNHTELTARIAGQTGLTEETVRSVLDAFEQTLEEGLSSRRWKRRTFDTLTRMMDRIRDRQENRL